MLRDPLLLLISLNHFLCRPVTILAHSLQGKELRNLRSGVPFFRREKKKIGTHDHRLRIKRKTKQNTCVASDLVNHQPPSTVRPRFNRYLKILTDFLPQI